MASDARPNHDRPTATTSGFRRPECYRGDRRPSLGLSEGRLVNPLFDPHQSGAQGRCGDDCDSVGQLDTVSGCGDDGQPDGFSHAFVVDSVSQQAK